MRDVKYRGYSEALNKFVYGYYLGVPQIIEGQWLQHFIVRDDGFQYAIQNRETIGQFTGLRDKNNVEVYENDIIEDDLEYLAVVKFGEHLTSTDYYASTAYGWYAERANGDTHSLAQCGTITVRGNIHEHPHLLERSVEE